MSAWVVHRNHIHLLVRGLAESEIVTDVSPDEIGRALWRENLRSVAYRYPDDHSGSRPGPEDFGDSHVGTYTYVQPAGALDRDALLKQARCYAYQSCEHPDWEGSDAHRWTYDLIERLTAAGHTGESDDIPWGWQWPSGTAPAGWFEQMHGFARPARPRASA